MTQTHSPSQEALSALKRGEAIVFPTDTLFGLGVSVRDASTPEVLYKIKNREKHKPIAWLVNDTEALDEFGENVPAYAHRLACAFWPGPLTIIVRANDNVPEAFRSKEGTIGMRMPANERALKLISELGCPIATTSANRSGEDDARSFEDLDAGLLAHVSAVIGDDEEKSGKASTIVDCSFGEEPALLREGAIGIADIRALI